MQNPPLPDRGDRNPWNLQDNDRNTGLPKQSDPCTPGPADVKGLMTKTNVQEALRTAMLILALSCGLSIVWRLFQHQPFAGISDVHLPPLTIVFFLCVLTSGAIAVSRLPGTWRAAITERQRRKEKIGVMGMLNALLGCFLVLSLGLVTVPVMLTSIIDLLILGIRSLIGQ